MNISKEDADDLISKLKQTSDDEIPSLVGKYKKFDLTSAILGRIFEKLYVNNEGFSSEILIDDLEKIHHSFRTKNGATWNRSGVSYLGKKYNIVCKHSGKMTTSVKCDGPFKNEKAKNIRSDIKKIICKKRCAILDISTNIECDHKDGMKDDWKVANQATQDINDFQPLCKTANDAKRSHCKKCRESGKRYDAKALGYSESFLYGDENSKTCVGCYWNDPFKFNKTISQDYKKIK